MINDDAVVDGQLMADPHSLEGMLQRGRGAGFRGALADPEAARALVLRCIHVDPRWDHQVESRGWYLASLVMQLDIDVTTVLSSLDGEADPTGDDELWLALDVLEMCAKSGVPGAADELFRYLRSGRDDHLAIATLLRVLDCPEVARGMSPALESVEVAEIANAFAWNREALESDAWSAIRREQPRADEASALLLEGSETIEERLGLPAPLVEATATDLIARAMPWRLVGQRLSGCTSAADRTMLRRVAASPEAAARPAALYALGLQGDDLLLDVALPIIDAWKATAPPDAARTATHLAVCSGLRALDTPRALAWARSNVDDELTGSTATAALAAHATERDTDMLRYLLREAIGSDEMYDQCALVDGLVRLGDDRCVPVLGELFESTVYSSLRRRCARGLAALSPGFAAGRAVECLWDCERETRQIAVEQVDHRTADVIERLEAMANDRAGESAVREAAEARLRQSSASED